MYPNDCQEWEVADKSNVEPDATSTREVSGCSDSASRMGLTSPCHAPADPADGATAKDLSLWTVGWVQAYGCERSKRAGLLEAWPR